MSVLTILETADVRFDFSSPLQVLSTKKNFNFCGFTRLCDLNIINYKTRKRKSLREASGKKHR